MADSDDHVELLTVPFGRVRLGTLVLLGSSLGWGLDDLTVTLEYKKVTLWRNISAVAQRPEVVPAFVDRSTPGVEAPPALVASSERQWEVFKRGEMPEPSAPVTPVEAATGDLDDAPTIPEVMAATDLPLTRFCRECGREFASRADARNHEDSDHRSSSALTCPDCGWVFGTAKGLGHHATMKHGDGGKVTPIADAPSRGKIVIDDDLAERVQRDLNPYLSDGPGPPAQWDQRNPMLGCGTCDWYGMEASALVAHTTSCHERRPTQTERTPLQPIQRDERLARASGG